MDRAYVRKFDLIIVFEDGGLIPFLRISGKKHAKIILWQWNIKEPSLAMRQRILKKVCQIWTFDPNDSKKYGWFLNSQFYSPEENAISPPYFGRTRKAFCACVDKGRYRTLKFIRQMLLNNRVNCDFLLVKGREIEYEKEDLVWIRDEGISYSVFLKKTLESDLIVDLVQEVTSLYGGFPTRMRGSVFCRLNFSRVILVRVLVTLHVTLENNVRPMLMA